MSAPEKSLPLIPDKKYFSIGETAQLCALKPHVLRYWEQEFSKLRPSTRRGGRRYYKRNDIDLIRLIRTLLYDKGYTIAGAKQALQRSQKLPELSVMNVTFDESVPDTIVSHKVDRSTQNQQSNSPDQPLETLSEVSSEPLAAFPASSSPSSSSSTYDPQFIAAIKDDLEALLKTLRD